MTSTASNGSVTRRSSSAGVEVVGAEGVRQDLAHRLDARGWCRRGSPAPPYSHSSWRQRPHGISGSPCASTQATATSRPPPLSVQGRDQAALGAQPHAVGGVLDVAADDDPAVVDQPGDARPGTASTARTRAASPSRASARRASQSTSAARGSGATARLRSPRPCGRRCPSAAGIRSRCEASASTSRVVMYGRHEGRPAAARSVVEAYQPPEARGQDQRDRRAHRLALPGEVQPGDAPARWRRAAAGRARASPLRSCRRVGVAEQPGARPPGRPAASCRRSSPRGR